MPKHNNAAHIFNSFDRIRIINLEHRSDRRREMAHQLSRVGIINDPRVEFFTALTGDPISFFSEPGHHGCYRSYVALLSEAADAGESILILEDDCDFIVPEIFKYRLSEKCDVFYGGYYASDPTDINNSDIIGSHFMGFSALGAATAKSYFSRYLSNDFVADSQASAQPDYNPTIRPPIDGAFVWFRRAHPELVTVFAMLGFQRPSRTDIGSNAFYDRSPGLRSLAGMARRIRQRLFEFFNYMF